MINNTSGSRLTKVYFNELANYNNLEYAQIMPQASIDQYDKDMGWRCYYGNSIFNNISQLLPPIDQYGRMFR